MRFAKITPRDVEVAADGHDDQHWSTEYRGHTIDVDLAEMEPGLWAINVAVRVASWSDHLSFTDREAARAAGEQLGKDFIDELD